MRSPIWFALLAVVAAVVPVAAQQPDKKDEPKLKIGDPAPPLTVGKWHQGPEVKAFEKGKVYVVVFWKWHAGNPRNTLRAIDAIHAKNKDIIPVAVSGDWEKKEPGQPSPFELEAEFVTKAKPKFSFAFANDKDRTTHKAYKADRVDNAVYVIGKDGRIAFIAPQEGEFGPYDPTDFLPEVLPKVLDGSWKGQKDADALAETEKEFQKVVNSCAKIRELGPDLQKQAADKQLETRVKMAAESLKEVNEFLKAHPVFAGQRRTLFIRAYLAVASGDKDVAAKAVNAVIAYDTARGTIGNMSVLAMLVGTDYAEDLLNPAVGADKLVGAIIDAALKTPVNSDEKDNLLYLMTATRLVGKLDKQRAIIDNFLQAATDDTPFGKAMLVLQFEAQVKQIEASLTKSKK